MRAQQLPPRQAPEFQRFAGFVASSPVAWHGACYCGPPTANGASEREAQASHLFDVGGAPATQAIYNLDRHWRNVRIASTHNPTFAKATSVGDFYVNGKAPPLNGHF